MYIDSRDDLRGLDCIGLWLPQRLVLLLRLEVEVRGGKEADEDDAYVEEHSDVDNHAAAAAERRPEHRVRLVRHHGRRAQPIVVAQEFLHRSRELSF